jgi:hypothetical protein
MKLGDTILAYHFINIQRTLVMVNFELSPRESAYNIFGALNARIDQIQRYQLEYESKKNVNFDEIRNRVFNLDPVITIPLIQGTLDIIESVLGAQQVLQEKIKKSLAKSAALFPPTQGKKARNVDESEDITEGLLKELIDYKKDLSEISVKLEILNIESASQPSDRIQWNMTIELLCDLFKVIREHGSIKEAQKGQLTSFMSRNFSVSNTNSPSKLNIQNHMSGKVNNLTGLKILLIELSKTANLLGEK